MNALALAKTMHNPKRRKSKYNAMRTIVGNVMFHSKGEANRWLDLKLMERAGEITDLRRQVPFKLLAWTPNGPEQIGIYRSDFQYRDMRTNQEVVEDFKGCVTAEFKRTQKIMKANYGIDVLVTKK